MNNNKKFFIIFICLMFIEIYVYIPLRIKKNFTRTFELLPQSHSSS
jgi:hypothetical protein